MRRILPLFFTLLTAISYAQNSLDFDGVNDEVQTTYPGVLGTASRTFEAWVYVSANAPASNLTILDYGSNSAGSRNTFVVGGDRSLRFISGGTNANINTAANVIPTAQWTHVAFVLSSGTGYLYVNGVQSATGNLSGVSTASGNENVKIGERVSGGSIRFHGSIDEVRIWNVARSASSILADMNIEYCIPPVGLKAYYKLNEGTAGGTNTAVTTAVDQILGNNGTLIGFSLTGSTSNWVLGSGITLAPVVNTQNIALCPGSSVSVGSNTYSSAGTYNDTLYGQSVNGCDSVIVTNLSFYTLSNDTNSVGICSGDSTTINGIDYFSTPGFYTDTLTAVTTGCDSIVSINLTVFSPTSGNQTLTECEGYSITVGSNTYSTSGTYIDTLFNANVNGCDSIVTTTLTILNHATHSQTLQLCSGEVAIVGSSVYSASGIYTDTLVGMAANGCDSIVLTDLTVNSAIDVSVTNNTSSLTISANNATASSYQWIDCTSGLALPGETNQSLLVTANGSYAVIITELNCSDTSSCTTYSTIGLVEQEFMNILVYPNPSNGKVNISNITEAFKSYDIRVVNVLGQTIYTASEMTDSNVEFEIEKSGLYTVEITQGNKQFRRKLIVE